MTRKRAGLLADAMAIGGAAAVVYGVYLLSFPAALIVAGLLLVAAGVWLAI